MDTVQFTCGNCDKEISVLREHLGTRVQCPYCESVVEAVDEDSESRLSDSGDDAESIFAADDEVESDDLFGAPRSSQIEMPTDPKIPASSPALAEPSELENDDDFLSSKSPPAEETMNYEPDFSKEPRASESAQFAESPDEFQDDGDVPVDTGPSALVERHRKPGMLTPLLLIFLIPYSIVMTIAVIYLYVKVRARDVNHMELLRDPNPNDGGPQRRSNLFPYNTELTASLKTKLKEPIQVGDVKVTPLKVVHDDAGTLELYLKVRNMSDNLRFNALPNSFVTYNPQNRLNPYTFLKSKAYEVFVDDVRWGAKQEFTRLLSPGQEDVAVLRTQASVPKQELVKRLLKIKNRPFLWRVQLRRGFVSVGGQDVSVTCVIGVEFTTEDVL